ncbi:glycosyltransferase [Patescibacteria group bacterium]|nr:glycosyltransferase [Patescibacteria group bacterium]MBP9710321.1 glycosyltransferase [Patescibacteria group bacterium]
MRILHINKFFDLSDGVDIYLHQVMQRQEVLGHETHILSTRDPKNVPTADSKYFVERFDLSRSEGVREDAEKAIRFLWNREAQHSLQEMIRMQRPDVIHLHNIYHHLSTSILAPIREAGIPCVQTLHDYKLACPNYRMFTEGEVCERCKGGKYFEAVKHGCLASGFVPNVLAALEMGMTKARQSYERTVRLFLCPSRFMLEKMEDWGEPVGKLRHLANPVELPSDAMTGGGGYLLYAGRLATEKGLASFLEAAIRIPELPVKIAGRGPDEERLRSLVRGSGVTHIEFVGFQTGEGLRGLRARAEALVSPSIWYENASLSILEGMADGLPCLVTRIGGNPELIEDGETGFLAKPGDVEDWVRVLRRFQAVSKVGRQQMGEAAREKIKERFLWSTHLEKLQGFYREAGAS